ncbi:TetR/AcrR family transcriptional regulator C-terminal domain-containing protein [Lacticaseibacillus pabuli]|uniref:TetR/AcrR family transcriptional regulator C-terminal domain-containing protein n=1 Tax=Lacticaseibacillus pabuli TaxID=3025672 RepID=A0ABY7WRR3_9LACO|nr:TetR/AcrR family transcriptional regulator C-terminal domain-containing protein [Lacticaseibacillus sp. KACC 23028]WDF82878.1 TetR/AcrR family transcriptional regulator C-terminal domain-containing protein [Lacticaseibacillus sp. KACC 23028]
MDTKTQIATATKQLTEHRDFATITVTTIMKTAGLRRQTFYDYFKDKYDVLEWIYSSEIGDQANRINFASWGRTLSEMVAYFANNRRFYQAVLAIDGQNAPKEVIRTHFMTVVCAALKSLSREEKVTLGGDYCLFMRELLADGLMNELCRWVCARDARAIADESEFLQTYIEDQVNGMLLRRRRINEYQHQSIA